MQAEISSLPDVVDSILLNTKYVRLITSVNK